MIKTQKIVLIGPESTGKTTITKELSNHFKFPYISEIARNYVENLNRKYTKSDVIKIAELQRESENRMLNQKHKVVFFDTDLIITKIWLKVVFEDCPQWISNAIMDNPADLYLLCYYDLPWQNDPVRENPNRREELYQLYLNEIMQTNSKHAVIKGVGTDRTMNAINITAEYLSKI